MALITPESTRAGNDAVVKFSVEPDDVIISELKLEKMLEPPFADSAVPVSTDIHYFDVKQQVIVFPKVSEESAGRYKFTCNKIFDTFNLNITPCK